MVTIFDGALGEAEELRGVTGFLSDAPPGARRSKEMYAPWRDYGR